MQITIKVNQEAFRQLADRVRAGMSSPAMRDGMLQAAKRYEVSMSRRFDAASRGNGEWADLAPATIVGRIRRLGGYKKLKTREGKLKRIINRMTSGKFSILRDTGVLRQALELGAPGSVLAAMADGVEVGVGGPAPHQGGPTIGQIATWNQQGTGRIPARPIYVQPDDDTVQAMGRHIANGLRATIQGG